MYDAVERLASLFARVFLTPLEESAAIYFSTTIRQFTQGINDIPKKAIGNFVSVLRFVFICGLIICIFGVPYSKIAVQIYGGELLVENDGIF